MTNNESTNDTAEQPVTPADMPKQSPADEAERGVPNGTPGSSLSASCEPVTPADEHTTFSREYVEELRGEAAKYRTRAKHT